MTLFEQALLTGALIGGVYGLFTMGLAIVFGTMRFVNFAQGDLVMVGMYVAYVLFTQLGIRPLLAIPLVAVGLVVLALALRWTIFRGIERIPSENALFITLGLSLILQNVALLIFGPGQKTAEGFNGTISLGALFVSEAKLVATGIALVLVAALWVLLRRTNIGLALRSVVSDREVAALLGIRTKRVYTLGLALGFALAGVAGAVLITYYPVTPSVGTSFLLLGFVAVVLGGLTNVFGAFVAGVVVGLTQQLSSLEVSAELQNVAVFILFVIVLLVRNRGVQITSTVGA